MIPLARRAANTLLGSSMVNRAVRALAQVRGHRLVLVYHRLGPPAPAGCEIVPSVPTDVFRAHLQALGEVVDLVTIDELLAEDRRRPGSMPGTRRPAITVTFDDDLPSHADQALPALRDFGVPAAFFLSGRAVHGRGAYWFQYLESLLIAYGEPRAAALLGVPGARAGGLALLCEGNAEMRRRLGGLAADLPPPELLEPAAIAALSAAGMAVGFHTVDHEILPGLDDAALAAAVSRGREDLAVAAGTAVRYFAYPHGKSDARSAAAVRRAGFEAAFTGHPRPLRNGDDLHRVGRWEPGPLGVDDLVVKIAVRLHRAAPYPSKGSR